MLDISSGRIAKPQKVVVYGPEGIGKSTFAAQFPDPVFIDTEGSTYHMEVLQAFADGEYNVLCNSMLLTEGWDDPSVDCVVVLRPTKVRSLYCQMVGRGTRLSPATGKTHLLLLDFLWHTEKHV